jgi:2-polyprenyl-6-methoxyphenol hydroxylase-like FAD-dependent oxidoreductase
MTTLTPASTERVQTLVVGAGPVGLFAALCAARRGLQVLLLDQSWRDYAPGHATLLHPSSLALLEEGGLAEALKAKGRLVERLDVHIDGGQVHTVTLPSPALAVAQSLLEEALLEALRKQNVELRAAHQATTIDQHDERVEVRVMRRELIALGSQAFGSEWEPVESSIIHADFVIGADGYDSRVRSALGIEVVDLGNTETFTMFELPTQQASDAAAQLCFNDELGSMMVPLAGERARWAFQINDKLDRTADLARFHELLAEREPGREARAERVDWGTVIQFERRLARRFGKRRAWLVGDAAHVTSPLGGHSMNVGLLEARDLVQRIADCVESSSGLTALERYGSERGREWHKLLGLNVRFDLLPHAPPWLATHARRVVPALPASGAELTQLLSGLGLRLV